MSVIYKICGRAEWAAAEAAGVYGGSADDARDGFIHFSTLDQVPGTQARHFAGRALDARRCRARNRAGTCCR